MQVTDEITGKNLYEILELKNTATKEAIKKAYRELVLKYHPDKNSNGSVAAEKFRAVHEAYRILGNAELREQYDRLSPDGQHYSPQYAEQFDGEKGDEESTEEEILGSYARFFAQMRFLMMINLLNILTWSPPTRTERSGLEDTGLKVAEGFSLSEIHQLLSQWLIDTGKVDQSYSCKLQNTPGQPCLLVQAPHKEGLDEIQEFLESHGLIESNAKELSQETEVDEHAQTHPVFSM
jgi:hypothetical protein